MKTLEILELRTVAILLIKNSNERLPPYRKGVIDALYFSGKITEASYHRVKRLLASIIRKDIICLKGK